MPVVSSGAGTVSTGCVVVGSVEVSPVAVVSVVVADVVVSTQSGSVCVGSSHGGGTLAGAGAARDPTAAPTVAASRAAAATEPMRRRSTGREPYEYALRGASVLEEVTLLLECLVSCEVGVPLRAAHREVRRREHRPERVRSAPRRPRARRAPPPASPAGAGCRAARARPPRSSPGRPRPAVGQLERRARARRGPAAIRPPTARYGLHARVRRLQLGVRRRLLHAAEDRRHADRRLAVVVAPARERAGPVLRDDAVVRVEARRGQRRTAPGGARARRRGTRAPRRDRRSSRRGVVEAVALAVPQREVDVAAVARAVGPRLRRERRDEPVLRRDAADRLAHEDLLVGRLQRRRVRGRDLLLAVPELGVVLLERDALLLERVDERVDVVLRRRHADRREAEARVDRARSRRRRGRRARTRSRTRPRAARRRARRGAPSIRFRNERGHCGAGVAVERRRGRRASRRCAARTAGRGTSSRSGTSRISPTGPIPSTGWSWSSAVHRLHRRRSGRCRSRAGPRARACALAFARTVPSLPHQRKRTRRRPASSAARSRRRRRRHCAWLRSNSSSQRASSDWSSSRARAVRLQRLDVAPVVGELALELGERASSRCAISPRSARARSAAASARACVAGCALAPSSACGSALDAASGCGALVAPADVLGPAAVVAADRPRPRARASARRPRRRARGRARRAGPFRGTPRARPRAPRATRGRGGSSARRARGSSRPTRRRARARAGGARRRRAPRPTSRARPSRRRGSARAAPAPAGARGSSRAASTRARCAARRARPPAARSSRRRRCGRAARCPSSVSRLPSIVSISVVFPEPFGPTSATCSPRSSANVASCSSSRSPIRSASVLRLDDGSPAARRIDEAEAEPPRAARQQRDLLADLRLLLREAADLRQLRLGLLRLRLLVAEARDEALEPRDVLRVARGLLRRRLQPRRLLEPPLVPRAGEVRRAAGVELEHGGRRRLEEPAVVRDEDDAGVERRQLVLEPLEARHVEVVRRLVEEQQVGVAAERARERGARQLAAGERVEQRGRGRRRGSRGRARPSRRARATRSRRRARAAPAPPSSDASVCGAVVARRHRLLQPPQLLLDRDEVGGAGEDVLAQRHAPLQRRALVVERDARALRERELAAVDLGLAGEHAQERRLAGAVRPGRARPARGARP